MKARLVTIAKWVLYPAFYVFCLALFGYLTFPFNRLKDRLIAEFDREQAAHGGHQHLEIGELDSYWFSGVEVTDAKLVIPPTEPPAKDETPKDAVITIDRAHARVRLLPLLIGRVRVDFWASAFGGEVSGSVPVKGGSGSVELSLEGVDLSKVAAIGDVVGVPLKGVASGTIELDAPDGKLAKANGSVDLEIKGVSVGDGKTKIKGQLALPEAKLGDLTLTAQAKDGLLKVTKLAAPGRDIDLLGDGKISLRDPWDESNADLFVKFKFSDAYRGKNDVTKSLLGAPGSNAPALMDLADPKIKKAKRPDGYYGWHVHGPLKRLRFDPSANGAPEASAPKGAKPSPFGRKAGGGLALPLGTSEAVHEATDTFRPSAPLSEHQERHMLPAPVPPPPPPPPPAAARESSAEAQRPAPAAPAPEPEPPQPAAAPEPPAQEAPAQEAPAPEQQAPDQTDQPSTAAPPSGE